MARLCRQSQRGWEVSSFCQRFRTLIATTVASSPHRPMFSRNTESVMIAPRMFGANRPIASGVNSNTRKLHSVVHRIITSVIAIGSARFVPQSVTRMCAPNMIALEMVIHAAIPSPPVGGPLMNAAPKVAKTTPTKMPMPGLRLKIMALRMGVATT